MICDQCKKNPVTVLITKLANSTVLDLHLCSICAQKMSINIVKEDKLKTKEINIKLVCPQCGFNYVKLKETGLLGCASCYSAFKSELLPLLRRLHGSSKHRGKVVFTTSGTIDQPEQEEEILKLYQKLRAAVESENFEEAARLRDLINKSK